MFAYPNIKVTRINLRPLTPDALKFDPVKFLKQAQKEIIKAMKQGITQSAFSEAAKRRLLKGFKVLPGRKSVTLVARDPAFRPLLEGQRAEQMKWLVKARAPIPIVLDSGELIFRTATARSMANGSWYHPGREPSHIIEKAKEEARKVLRAKAKRMLRKQLREMFKR